ncbi:hypothetical protein CPB97_009157 [Podila verticillata]|nr:hypothetical protein CPB97_009157 [Podila verticillata]
MTASPQSTQKAQTIKDQSQNMASSPILVASASSSPQIHNSLPTHPIFAAMSQSSSPSPQQNHHHLQILGNHPASPVNVTFLDLPADPFMPTRANLLFPGDEYDQQEYQEPISYENSFMPYSSTEDCSSEYMYAKLKSSSSFPQDQYVASMGSYMAMTRLPQLSEDNMTSFGCLPGQAGLNQATGARDSLGYSSHIVYDDDYYHAAQHHLYAQQAHMNHHHSYSTSLSSISEDSASMSPRSPFSSNLSSSSTSAASYPLARTLSDSSVPALASGVINNVPSASGLNPDGTPIIRPTPKRSRGRRVSCNPDNSGCKVFTCRFSDCGKIFKRSEHLKRHVRSIHTMEKPFECPIQNCPKRFSRSDNLNQHIRIHRHSSRGEKGKNFPAFTPFMGTPYELMSLS